MNEYAFTFTLVERLDDLDPIDAFYGKVNDASVAGGNGVSVVHFDREAGSLDEAIRTAMSDVQAEGWQIRSINVEPECLLQLSN